jgi:hypothetical protein
VTAIESRIRPVRPVACQTARRWLAGGLLAATLAPLVGCAAIGAGGEITPRVIDAQASDELKRMTDYLASLPRFSFDAEIAYDDYLVETQKVQLGKTARVEVQRPSRARAVIEGDVENKRYWYDGQQVVIFDVDRNQYSKAPAPDTIDAALAMLSDRGIVLPLAELVGSGSYDWLMNGVQSASYVGLHRVGGAACHHLAFEQDTLDWQIWVDASETPVPRRMLVSYKNEPAYPQYQATFTRWDTASAAASPGDFSPQIPADAVQIELTAPESVVGSGTPMKQ